MPNSISVISAPMPADGRPGQDGERMDEVLVEDAEDDVDHQHGGEQQHALVGDGLLEDLGAALEAGGDVWPAGRPRRRPPGSSATASPSATPGARLNEMMTDGSWAMWLTVSDVGLSLRLATVSSGTSAPVGVRTWMRRSTSLVSAYFGSASRITW